MFWEELKIEVVTFSKPEIMKSWPMVTARGHIGERFYSRASTRKIGVAKCQRERLRVTRTYR
jgi:hypothetical protein